MGVEDRAVYRPGGRTSLPQRTEYLRLAEERKRGDQPMKTYWRTAAAVAALAGALTLGALLPATPGHTQVARQVVRVLQNGPNDAVPVILQGTGAITGSINVA